MPEDIKEIILGIGAQIIKLAGALDSKTGVEVLKLLKKQCNGNNGENTVIIVTHNSLFAEIADTVVRVKNGKIESVTKNENPKKIDEVNW